jgi:hypothetical protein
MLKSICGSPYRVLLTVAISFGILIAPLVSHAAPGRWTTPVPRSMDELLHRVTLVFFGEVGPVEQCLDFSGYDWDGSLRATPIDCYTIPTSLNGLFPVTDFQLIIEEVWLDDGTIATGNSITIRMMGLPIDELVEQSKASEFPWSLTGDRHLFVLVPNPDRSYSLSYGAWSRLIIDGEILRISNGDQTPLKFSDNEVPVTLEEFKQAVASQQVTNKQANQVYVPLIHGVSVHARVDTTGDLSFLDTVVTTVVAFWEQQTSYTSRSSFFSALRWNRPHTVHYQGTP